MWSGGTSALSALSPHTWEVWNPCSGLAVGTGKARGLLCQHCESLGVTELLCLTS